MSSLPAPILVAIDGPGGVGKTTAARRLAAALRIPYLETGAMYRALGLELLDAGIDPGDEAAVVATAAELALELEARPSGEVEIRLDGVSVAGRLRDEEVARVTSRVAAYPGVRQRMVDLQRRFGMRWGGVVEGRDIGTKVFPETPFKFFLDADPAVRLRRRLAEHAGRGAASGDPEALGRQLAERDRRDAERADSPLRKDSTYVVLDTTELTAGQVVARLLEEIERISGGTVGGMSR